MKNEFETKQKNLFMSMCGDMRKYKRPFRCWEKKTKRF